MSKKRKRVHPRKRTGRRTLSQYKKPLRHLFKKKRAQGLTVCYAVLSYGVFERLAGLEHRHLAGGIGHGLAGTGIAANTGGTLFGLEAAKTHQLYRYAGSPDTNGSLDNFSDASTVNSYAVNAMQWAVANGIVNGSNGKLNPQNNATRAEVAAILMRFCEMSK